MRLTSSYQIYINKVSGLRSFPHQLYWAWPVQTQPFWKQIFTHPRFRIDLGVFIKSTLQQNLGWGWVLAQPTNWNMVPKLPDSQPSESIRLSLEFPLFFNGETKIMVDSYNCFNHGDFWRKRLKPLDVQYRDSWLGKNIM